MIESGYKIIAEIDGKLSSWMRPILGRSWVQYKPGEETFPEIEGSALFVFDKLSSAKRYFCRYRSDEPKDHTWQIWECYYDPWDGCDVYLIPPPPTSREVLERFWSSGCVSRNPMMHLPRGTMLAKSIVLTRRVA